MQVVLPGDAVRQIDQHESIKLGPGVIQLAVLSSSLAADASKIQLVATRSGILGGQTSKSSPASNSSSSKNAAKSESCWVESQSRRYTPAAGEPVVGVIVARHAEGYRVDIGGSQMAALDALAFEDATKRSKPNLKVGAVVYARVSLALPFCESEIECFDAKTGKSQGFGDLNGGTLIRNMELGKCRALLSSSNTLLPSLGERFPFELAIGVNGRIWVKCAEPRQTIELVSALRDA